MSLAKLLCVQPGVTAVIGGGGKTTLLRTLGEELSARHRVLLCTTTKIFPFDGIPCAHTAAEMEAFTQPAGLWCMGTPAEQGKLTVPAVSLEGLASCFDYVFVEADGAAGRPLKAHASHEPVIPPCVNQAILVVGASGFYRPISEAAHRPEIYAKLSGVSVKEEATAETQAAVLQAEGLHDRVFVNQVETLPDLLEAKCLAALLRCPLLAGSLQREEYFKC